MEINQLQFDYTNNPQNLASGKIFDGSDIEPAKDNIRLSGQLLRIFDFIKSGGWHTLREIEQATGAPTASVSAQLRNLKKAKFGAHCIDKRRAGDPAQGIWQYRLIRTSQFGMELR